MRVFTAGIGHRFLIQRIFFDLLLPPLVPNRKILLAPFPTGQIRGPINQGAIGNQKGRLIGKKSEKCPGIWYPKSPPVGETQFITFHSTDRAEARNFHENRLSAL